MRFRLMTYNVHGCVGMDGRHSPGRIADVIAQAEPDVVALQELYCDHPERDGADQAAVIAEKLAMQFTFAPARHCGPGQYGNAVLSRHPLRLLRAEALPRFEACEERAALHVVVGQPGAELDIVNTHLGLRPRERALQTRALAEDWLSHVQPGSLSVLCGDLNSWPGSAAYAACTAVLRDVQRADGVRARRTWPAFLPVMRLDHVFVSDALVIERVEVPRTKAHRAASDHLPLIVDLSSNGAVSAAPAGAINE